MVACTGVRVRFVFDLASSAYALKRSHKTGGVSIAPRGHTRKRMQIGNLLFGSGQCRLIGMRNLVQGTVAQETAQALENIRAIVEAAEGTIADIVQCYVYISGPGPWAEVKRPLRGFFSEVPCCQRRCGAGSKRCTMVLTSRFKRCGVEGLGTRKEPGDVCECA